MAALMLPAMALAHPMPDSEIVVARGGDRVDLTIRVPMNDLLLAMEDDQDAAGLPRDADALLAGDQSALRTYLGRHMALETEGKAGNRRVPLVIDVMGRVSDTDSEVGHYSELEIEAHGLVADTVPVRLVYDLVLERIANHRALVSEPTGKAIGVVRYNLAEKKAETLALPVVAGLQANAPIGSAQMASAPKERPVLQSVDVLIGPAGWLLIFAVPVLATGIGLWLWRRRMR